MKRQEATLDVDIPRYNQRRAGQQRVGQRQRVHLRVAAGFGCERIDEHPADAQGAYRNVRRGQIGQSVSGVQVGITRMTKVVLLLGPLRHCCATGFWLSSWRVRTIRRQHQLLEVPRPPRCSPGKAAQHGASRPERPWRATLGRRGAAYERGGPRGRGTLDITSEGHVPCMSYNNQLPNRCGDSSSIVYPLDSH